MSKTAPAKTSEEIDYGECAVWPRLTRFYGISPAELEAMPGLLRRMYARAIDELAAAEQLLALEASVFPHLKKNDAQRVHRRYERTIRVRQQLRNPQQAPKLTVEEMSQRLHGMGIKVEVPGA